MTKGDKRRNRRKYKVRYDRLAVFLLVTIVLAVIITSCVKAVTGKDVTEPIESQLPTTAPTDPAEATEPWEDNTLPEPEPVTEAPKYKDYTVELHKYDDTFKGDLVLVNSQYEYRFMEDDIDVQTLYDHKSSCYDVSDNVVSLDSTVIEQLSAMMEAFKEENSREGTGIWVFDGYRTYNEQAAKRSDGLSSFEPGHTDYHTGRTFDMLVMHEDGTTDPFKPEGDYEWFADHAADYGFITRYPQDKSDITGEKARTYTFRYVGVPHAKYITKHGLCLEEYIEQLKGYTIEKPLEVEGDGCGYRIYFVPLPASDKIEVLVPEKERYTVSGNNSDGFIVTVTTK
ncbi:MAG: D-alanyl-D-alanine carboxypeptidase family protein [Ruminococcus sp.]|nr:D-alanyl-D-alanine carboxypeptidase family protein [Ruminococcus sp.]